MHYQNIANNFIFINIIFRIYKVEFLDIKFFFLTLHFDFANRK